MKENSKLNIDLNKYKEYEVLGYCLAIIASFLLCNQFILTGTFFSLITIKYFINSAAERIITNINARKNHPLSEIGNDT